MILKTTKVQQERINQFYKRLDAVLMTSRYYNPMISIIATEVRRDRSANPKLRYRTAQEQLRQFVVRWMCDFDLRHDSAPCAEDFFSTRHGKFAAYAVYKDREQELKLAITYKEFYEMSADA